MIILNVSTPDSGLGDGLRQACIYINQNFDELNNQVVFIKGSGTNSIRSKYATGSASGSYGVSLGYSCEATGNYSTATGYSKANGNYTQAGGYQTIASGIYSFVHGANSTASNSSTIVLGSNITGTQADTTYVDKLNIKTVNTGTAVSVLGLDASNNVIKVTGGGGGDSRPYKVYTALLSQTEEENPVAIVLENTLGATVSWTRYDSGYYQATTPGAVFTTNKTAVFIESGRDDPSVFIMSSYKVDTTTVEFTSVELPSNTGIDGALRKTIVEIRVYN